MTLQETIQKYYVQGNYNCSETLIHAANEYYDLKLDEDSMKVLSGFGGGMFVCLSALPVGHSSAVWQPYLKK